MIEAENEAKEKMRPTWCLVYAIETVAQEIRKDKIPDHTRALRYFVFGNASAPQIIYYYLNDIEQLLPKFYKFLIYP